MKKQATRKAGFPVSVQAGILAAAILSLWGALGFYNFESAVDAQSQNRDPYMIGAQLERMSGVRQSVPENAILGYLTDAEPSSTVAIVMFDSAQYALAPRLLRTSATGDWVLGNFTRPLDFQSIGASQGLLLDRDFGNGVVLYRNGER